jgi:precorrin-3B C17-methyltransferase
MSGSLTVIGLGPGPAQWLTPAASEVLERATDLVGYGPYLDRVPPQDHQRRHASDNRVEIERARLALDLAAEGRHVAVVSGGDPGVFAMAAAVFEVLDGNERILGKIPISIEPGITAMLAAASRVGAPLGGDFCAISLSDNLKPWELVETRIKAALAADFVIALYNPISSARAWQLGAALQLALAVHPENTPVIFARAVGRPNETITVARLAEAATIRADMSTLVIIGSSTTRIIPREGQNPYVYTPRFYGTRP